MDWKSLVDQLIAVQQIPVTNLQADKSAGAKKITTLGTLQSNLTALQTSVKALSADGLFAGRSAKIADTTSAWTTSAAAGTEPGQYSFNVSKLATKAQRNGSANVGAGISATDNVAGVTLATMNISTAITAGSFTVNGKKIDIALTDSLESVFTKMSDGTGVTASYDHLTDTVKLNSANPILLGSASDTSNILTALKLYNNGTKDIASMSPLGVPKLSATIENANLKTALHDLATDGAGTFGINGISIDFNSKTDSLQAVINRINASSAGVVAAYDKTSDKFTLTNKITGDMGLTVSDDPNGFLESLGLNSTSTFANGKNAEFSINGGDTILSTSNSFTSDVTGVTGLTVTATSEGTQTVNVGTDNTGVRAKIDDFITKYNAVQDYIEAQTKITKGSDGKVTTSTLTSERDVGEMSRSLRSMVFGAVPGLTGAVKRLADIGIDFKSDTSNLEVKDSAKLDTALTNNADKVAAIFNTSSTGLSAQLDAYVNRVTGTGGLLASLTESLNKQSTSIDEQIARLTARIAEDRARMEASFIAMEQAQSNIQLQLTALNNAFGSDSSNDS